VMAEVMENIKIGCAGNGHHQNSHDTVENLGVVAQFVAEV